MKLTDEILKRAVSEARDESLSRLPQETGDHRFSEQFEREMDDLLRRRPARRFRRRFGRVAAVTAAALVLLSVTVMSVEALRVRFFRLVSEKAPEYTAFSYQADAAASAAAEKQIQSATENFEPYAPRYLPRGYVLEHSFGGAAVKSAVYRKSGEKQGPKIVFTQGIMGTGTTAVDTENASVKEILIGDEKATFISKKEMNALVWNNDVYSFVLIVEAPEKEKIPEKETIRIAESVEPEK